MDHLTGSEWKMILYRQDQIEISLLARAPSGKSMVKKGKFLLERKKKMGRGLFLVMAIGRISIATF